MLPPFGVTPRPWDRRHAAGTAPRPERAATVV